MWVNVIRLENTDLAPVTDYNHAFQLDPDDV